MTAADAQVVSRHVASIHPGIAVTLSESGYSVDVDASQLDRNAACDLMDALVASLGGEGRDWEVWMCLGDRAIHITEEDRTTRITEKEARQ